MHLGQQLLWWIQVVRRIKVRLSIFSYCKFCFYTQTVNLKFTTWQFTHLKSRNYFVKWPFTGVKYWSSCFIQKESHCFIPYDIERQKSIYFLTSTITNWIKYICEDKWHPVYVNIVILYFKKFTSTGYFLLIFLKNHTATNKANHDSCITIQIYRHTDGQTGRQSDRLSIKWFLLASKVALITEK